MMEIALEKYIPTSIAQSPVHTHFPIYCNIMFCLVLLSIWLLPALSCQITWRNQCALATDQTSLATCILAVSTVREILHCASYDATKAVGMLLPEHSVLTHLTRLDLISPDRSPYGGLVPGQGDDGLDRMLYVSPKGILMYAARSEKCQACHLASEFTSCPWDMPGFIGCLCYRRVRPEHIDCLERCVPRTKLISPVNWNCTMAFLERRPRMTRRDFNEVRASGTAVGPRLSPPLTDHGKQMEDGEPQIQRLARDSPLLGEPFTYDSDYNRQSVTFSDPNMSTYTHLVTATDEPFATEKPDSITISSTTFTGELESGSSTELPKAGPTTASGGDSGAQSTGAPSAATSWRSHGIWRMVLVLGLLMLV